MTGEPVPPATRRMPRGALFAFASLVSGVAIAGCGSEVAPSPTPTDSGSQVDTGGAVPAYGAPAPDTGIVGEDTSGMVDDTGGAVPLYGGAPDM